MSLLYIGTILIAGLMIGNELAVSLFMNPAVRKLDDGAMARELARSLGRVMPFWYALCLVLLTAAAWLHWHGAGGRVLASAAGLWLAILLYTILLLVPINSRLASGAAGGRWREDLDRWDGLHRWRIALLVGAMVLLLVGLGV